MTIKPTTEIPSKYNGKTIYSFSRLQSYHNCEYGFFLNYKLHKDGVQNMYSLLGGVVHENMEKLVYNQMTNEEALKIFREKLFEYTEILNYKFPSPKIQQNFVECVENYIKLYSPIPHKEFYSELEFYTDINGIPLHGFIDGVVFKENDKVVVIDYKTSTKFTKKDLQEKGLQLALYSYALEKEYGVKIDNAYFVMLKYCTIKFDGKTKPREIFCLRNEIIKSLRSELKKDLREFDYAEHEIELLLDKAESSNDMAILPQQIQDKYTICEGLVEFELNEQTRQDLIDFVVGTVEKIENKSDNENEWKPKYITEKTSFFCSVLCGQRTNCKFYKAFIEGNKDKFEPKTTSIDDDMARLFG